VDEAYGRITKPQRYRDLGEAARDLVDELTARFVVDRVAGLQVDQDLAARGAVETIVRLAPAAEGAGQVTVAWTRFPGLLVRFGRWHVAAYPACGCDACDEDPEALVEEFRHQVGVLVEGGFTETWTGGPGSWLLYEFAGRAGRAHGRARVDPRQARHLGAPARIAWRPWTLRDPAKEA